MCVGQVNLRGITRNTFFESTSLVAIKGDMNIIRKHEQVNGLATLWQLRIKVFKALQFFFFFGGGGGGAHPLPFF